MDGWSETEDATVVKDQAEKQTGKKYREFKAVKYRIKNVEGGQLLVIKVHVGGADYIHLRVIQIPLLVHGAPDPKEILRGVEQHKTKDNPLEPFTI
ncbi:leukocyte cysteine proteinase inhibitor 1-like [Epinephelus fuscoguttatus]|uniref:leukocyte cysteine proteinase inhibitor 1-like n=1 Tax=Epinephelus fuscoguttatus TaxID=293821 RepID=UPI0020D180CF|nr:leukocyte cysteine proteinase inhibitor 1-like [Epinephelus fuscoguttatus]